jgi:hypothetical protein
MTMAMTNSHPKSRLPAPPSPQLDLVSLGVLLIAVIAVALVLTGMAVIGTSPLAVIPPTVLAFWAVLSLKR